MLNSFRLVKKILVVDDIFQSRKGEENMHHFNTVYII